MSTTIAMTTPEPDQYDAIFKLGGGLLAGLTVVAAAWSKLTRSLTSDKVARTMDEAHVDLVDGLRDELKRLQAQNSELAAELNKAQLLAARLQSELGRITSELETLQRQLERLQGKTNHDSSF